MQLTLKPFSPVDAQSALDILTNNDVKQTYMLPDFESREAAHPLFQRLLELSRSTDRYVRGIYLKDQLIGFLNDVEIHGTSMELGYVIHPNHCGKGYMTEALRAAISELFQKGYRKIIAGAFDHNIASIRVMEKAGMQRLNKSDTIEYRGEVHHCIYYSIENLTSE